MNPVGEGVAEGMRAGVETCLDVARDALEQGHDLATLVTRLEHLAEFATNRQTRH